MVFKILEVKGIEMRSFAKTLSLNSLCFADGNKTENLVKYPHQKRLTIRETRRHTDT
jgi:hypothetical protein